MIYITLDTCVWLELLKIDLHDEINVFEELCYWIENNQLTHITPENIIREWDRKKVNKSFEIIKQVKQLSSSLLNPFKGNAVFNSVYQPDIVEDLIKKRIERVDSILKIHSKIARENSRIFDQAIHRNLDCLAPNHLGDSFRDTVNILTLIYYIKDQGFSECYFSTVNYTDFSSVTEKYYIHPQLANEFQNAPLNYVFFDPSNFGGKLFNVLRPKLPSFQDFLKDQTKKEQERSLATKKEEVFESKENLDHDFLENIKYIDQVLSKVHRTAIDEEIISLILRKHESYQHYFFKNVGNNGLV